MRCYWLFPRLLALAALEFLGCAESGGGRASVSAPELTLVDSIVWTVSDSTIVDPVDFTAAGGILAIADRVRPDVRILDSRGQLIRTIGRRGAGPGEFRDLDGIAVSRNGEIAVTDSRNNRVSLFSINGDLLAEFRVSDPLGAVVVDTAGHIHVDHRSWVLGEPGTDSGTVSVHTRSGEVFSTYGDYQRRQHPVGTSLHNSMRFALAPDGSIWTMLSYRGLLQRRDGRGKVLTRITLPGADDLPADRAYVRRISAPGEMERVTIIGIPVADDLAVGSMGRVFVAYMVHEEGRMAYTRILVYNGAGEHLADFRLPYRAVRLAVDNDRLYVLHRSTFRLPAIDIFAIE